MKHQHYTILACILTLVSCKQPSITFAETQPVGKKPLKSITNKMTGSYFCVNDSATLVIEPMMIRKFYVDKDTIPNQIYIDTIFSLHRGDVLKKYKGFYFLNSSSSTNNWEVKKVAMRNGILTIGNINSEEEILAMEKITGVLSDSTKPYVAKPTKQQLKQFLKANGFKEEEIYVRE